MFAAFAAYFLGPSWSVTVQPDHFPEMYSLQSLLLALTPVEFCIAALAAFNPKYEQGISAGQISSIPVDLTSHFNNQGFGQKPGESNFDGYGSKFKKSTSNEDAQLKAKRCVSRSTYSTFSFCLFWCELHISSIW
jgi:hypothetical protein